MQDVWHQLLEARVLDAGYALGAGEIGRCLIAPGLRLRALYTRNLVTSPSALPSLRL